MDDYVLFLDDERQPPKPKQWMGLDIVHAKTPSEFCATIEKRGAPFALLMDWHLGSGKQNGLELTQWLIDYDRQHDIIPEDMMYDSHSSDWEKARDIVRLIGAYIDEKFRPAAKQSA